MTDEVLVNSKLVTEQPTEMNCLNAHLPMSSSAHMFHH